MHLLASYGAPHAIPTGSTHTAYVHIATNDIADMPSLFGALVDIIVEYQPLTTLWLE